MVDAFSTRRSDAVRLLALSLALVGPLALAPGARAQNATSGAAVFGALTGTTVPQPQTLPQTLPLPQVTAPGVFAIRRGGMGPGGFLQLCDDPLDPRAIENECNAAGIAQ